MLDVDIFVSYKVLYILCIDSAYYFTYCGENLYIHSHCLKTGYPLAPKI